tara:strand:+ start:4902 stop:5435 length:534 start_codon:yes stop_codon:yes gene_type:complete
MTDSIEELKAQIEKLKEKNIQLLDEKRKAQNQRDEVQAQLEKVQAERDRLDADIQRITVEQPRQALFESMAAKPELAAPLERELRHHFDIQRDDNGDDVLVNRDGSPFAFEGSKGPVMVSYDNLERLYRDGRVKSLGAFLRGSGATGGGAAGSKGTASPANHERKRDAEQAPRFGMR